MSSEFRYIGMYSYQQNDLQKTKMISWSDDKNIVIGEVLEHSEHNQKPLSNYHISEYQSNWDVDDRIPPVKTAKIDMGSYAT